MIAVRSSIPWVVFCILGTAFAASALAADPDPHEIYQLTGEQMRSGNLKAAAASATRLRDFITRHPEWDPDGVFAQDLLPSMESRLRRLQLTARELEQFTDRALSETKPPRIAEDQNAARVFGDWATSTIDRLRRERDGLILTALPSPEDQAVLLRTESYAKSQHLLEDDILRLINEAIKHEVKILLSEDQRLETVHTRLDQIKKGMVESVIERDRLQRQMEDLQAKSMAYEGALIGLIFDGSGPVPARGAAAGADLGSVFAGLLDRELQALRSQPSQTRDEYFARRKSVERYRRCNRVLTQAGVIEDQTQRIVTLAEVVESTPTKGAARALAWISGWVGGLVTGFLTAAAAGFGWAAARRRRQRAEAPKRSGTTTSRGLTEFPHGQDGTNAA